MNLDFSTSLYLGIRHSSGELHKWDSLTTGAPAAFFEPSAAVILGRSIARLQGLADGLVAPSTLHLFWDWFGQLSSTDMVFADAQLYQVGAWGVERAAGKGIRTVKFRHQSASALQQVIRQELGARHRPIVVTDGWCPFCGKAAPLNDYLHIIRPYNGLLVVDDTQALGILGHNPGHEAPYGYGGSGLLKYLNIKNGDHIVAISSLAKAFGAPMAVMSSSKQHIQRFKRHSETRVNSSSLSGAALAAGKNALQVNADLGTPLRENLLRNVIFFKKTMAENGFETTGQYFPVQTIAGIENEKIQRIHANLWKCGIRTVPVLAHGSHSKLCWLLHAHHSETDIEKACQVFLSSVRTPQISYN